MKRLLSIVLILLPVTAVAQADDAAYCASLSALARRYTGLQGDGKNTPDADTAIAIDQCQKGNTAAAIPVLERKLRSGGFTLPKRS